MLLLKTLANYTWAWLKIPFLVPKPVQLQIEPSSICNLRCRMCNLNKNKGKDFILKLSNYQKILQQLTPLKSINLTGVGESLINPNLTKLIKIAKSKDISVSLITNAQLLNKKLIKKIIDSKIDIISISMESGIAKTYQSIRLGASFKKLKENCQNLVNYNRQQQQQTEIYINILLSQQNIDNLQHIFTIIDFAKQIGISNITCQNAHDIRSTKMDNYYFNKNDLLNRKFQQTKEYAQKANIKIQLPATKIKKNSCYYPWVYPQITSSGQLLPCCVLPQFANYSQIVKKFSWGNLNKQNFKTAWNNQSAYKFRKQFKNNPYCQHCSKYLGIL